MPIPGASRVLNPSMRPTQPHVPSVSLNLSTAPLAITRTFARKRSSPRRICVLAGLGGGARGLGLERREGLDVGGGAGDDHEVVVADHGVRRGVGERLAGA